MAYNCYADPNPPFEPAMRLIASITKGETTTIETTFAHGYLTGLIVRLKIPYVCRMEQLDNYMGPITVTSATTFTVNVNSQGFESFTIPVAPNPAWSDICAQVLPIGELNNNFTSAIHRS